MKTFERICFGVAVMAAMLVAAPASFNLVSPSNYSFDVDIYPLLDWEDAADIYLVTYTVQIGSDPHFTTGTYVETSGISSSEYYPDPDLKKNGLYYWRVMAVNANPAGPETTMVAQWANPWQFQVIPQTEISYVSAVAPLPMNRTFITENSPYYINGDVIVSEGNHLVIQPGIDVRFKNTSSGLNIKGKLVAQGTESDSIFFRYDGTQSKGKWMGILLNSTADSSEISGDSVYVSGSVFEYVHFASTGASARPAIKADFPLLVNHARFEYCSNIGIYTTRGHVLNASFYEVDHYGIQNAEFIRHVDLNRVDGGLYTYFSEAGKGNDVSIAYATVNKATSTSNGAIFARGHKVSIKHSSVDSTGDVGVSAFGGSLLTIDSVSVRNSTGNGFYVRATDTIRLNHLTSSKNTVFGMEVYDAKLLLASDLTITDNTQIGLKVDTGVDSAVVLNSTMDRNLCTGLAIYASHGVYRNLLIRNNDNKQITSNSTWSTAASYYAGGIMVSGSHNVLDSLTVTDNRYYRQNDLYRSYTNATLTFKGGGIYIMSGAKGTVLTHSEVSNNTMYARNIYYGSTYSYNHRILGAGVAVEADSCSLRSNVIAGNVLSQEAYLRYGGGIYVAVGLSQTEIRHNVVDGNTTNNGSGGGLYLTNATDVLVLDSNTIINNQASSGGGVYSLDKGIQILSNTISNNTAENGGGIYADSVGVLTGNTITNNTVSGQGGAVYMTYAAKINNNIITYNNVSTSFATGGIYGHVDTLWFNNLNDNANFFYRNTNSEVTDARYNWWGTRSDEVTIGQNIWDAEDNPNSLGLATYQPFLTNSSDSIPGALAVVTSLNLMNDNTYQNALTIYPEPFGKIFARLEAQDGNHYSRDITAVILKNEDNGQSISPILKETLDSSGTFVGYATLDSITSLSQDRLKVSVGDSITIYSVVDGTKLDGAIVGANAVTLRGDANGDGAVNVLDVSATVDYILNRTVANFQVAAADVNDDSFIDLLDVIGMVRVILGKRMVASDEPVVVYADRLQYSVDAAGNDYVLHLNLNGASAGLQIEMDVPDGLELDLQSTQGLDGMTIEWNQSEQGLKVLVFDVTRSSTTSQNVSLRFKASGSTEGIVVNSVQGVNGQKQFINGQGVEIATPWKMNRNAHQLKMGQALDLRFQLVESGVVRATVLDIRGRQLRTLLQGQRTAGELSLTWDGTVNERFVQPGIYLLRVQAASASEVHTVLVLP